MHEIEKNILLKLQKGQDISVGELDKAHALPLGTLSQAFFNDPCIKKVCNLSEKLDLRIAVEVYLVSDRSKPHHLERIEAAILKLIKIPAPMWGLPGLQSKAAGTYLMTAPPELVRQIYQLEDMPLTHLFQKHFPLPPARLFGEGPVPDVIQKRERTVLETMKRTTLHPWIEPCMIKVQRCIRMKKRHQEEVNRILQRAGYHINYAPSAQIRQWAEALLRDANKPYQPKCAPALSARIMAAAKKVSAFSTVSHITSETALQSIFDDAFYGRRTLLDFYIPFNAAALGPDDLLNGDGNVVCLGPKDIDPLANGEIIIEFDLPKLIQNKPAAFYKQRDFEYRPKKIRHVRFGNATISFDHTGSRTKGTQTWLKVAEFIDGLPVQLKADASKSSLIAYDLKKMHEILALNFFRFMDGMNKVTDLGLEPAQDYINHFYQKVDKLTDEALVLFLTDIEKNMTDTAEFNFYGAHQVDFSTILNITARNKGYALNLPKFIHDLNLGHMNELRKARLMIPALFKSYRFIDYLLLNIQSKDVRYYLDDLRKQCKTPQWIDYTSMLIPQGLELSWEMSAQSETHEPAPVVATTIEKETKAAAAPTQPSITKVGLWRNAGEQVAQDPSQTLSGPHQRTGGSYL
jgi:hypothetical protein